MQQLKLNYREEILADVSLQAKIAMATGRTIETVKRWCREKNDYLTLTTVVDVIIEHKNLPKNSILTEEVENVVELSNGLETAANIQV